MPEKYCPICMQTKNLQTEFHKNAVTADGHQCYCKACTCAINRGEICVIPGIRKKPNRSHVVSRPQDNAAAAPYIIGINWPVPAERRWRGNTAPALQTLRIRPYGDPHHD